MRSSTTGNEPSTAAHRSATIDNARQASPTVVPTDSARARRDHVLRNLERFGLLIVFVLLTLMFSFLKPDVFPTLENWRGIGITQSVVAVAAMALIIPLNTGRFDVSVGSNMVLSSVVAGSLMSSQHWPLLAVVVVTVLFGAFIGLVNGIVIAQFGVNSLVATLGVSTVLDGLVLAKTSGAPITNGLSSDLLNFGVEGIVGVPLLVVVFLAVAALSWYLLIQTPFGRSLTAVGSNVDSATLVGLPVRRIVLLSFVAAGSLGGLGGLMLIALQGNANPSTSGIGIVLPALAAAFLGATAFTPGRFNVLGTLVGLFFVAGTVSGLSTLGAASWVEPVFNGAALVLAVALSTQIKRRRTGVKEIGA